ncbi:MAG TPA: 2-C-methyl-D-erythritol 4-phosphate cytidylyltransferase [Candidatus Mediterraneibacter stercoravium]|uniref:2-C-methyl-D-erythritol 4-phosphate cytidylyltransferase n=1 Tax=Candidatus Mediterraneibacter stercoravium TaxID=2838685 RepID=A0A9D2G8Z7_9FIRM|nr:2-C-methyl-D-erythritol 4-phosphate cytidylyltransferase [Candidatus Mediterraneibacter stercoravium]
MEKKYCTAVVLAAGSGRRMGTKVHKQYLLLDGKPVLYYSLKTFQESELIERIILVSGRGEEDWCRKNIVEKYALTKVTDVVSGGKERYDSVWNGLQRAGREGYVYIHDGARPFVDKEMIRRAYECVIREKACVAGMPVKDTIKVVDEEEFVTDTPDRSSLWMVQTPQVFESELITDAYSMLKSSPSETVTDDAMVVERMMGLPVKMFRGSYENIKITTPEDMDIAEVFLKKKKSAF